MNSLLVYPGNLICGREEKLLCFCKKDNKNWVPRASDEKSTSRTGRSIDESPFDRWISVRSINLPQHEQQAIVKLAYPDKSDYMAFMGQYSSIVGVTTAFMLLVGKEVIKYLGWEVGALATPVVMAGLAVPFFG